jgi:selenide,water dikinase
VAIPAPHGAIIVQSLDMLRQLVSDPWVMGRIAANHALSDLYACGARPVSALAALTLPFASTVVLQRELKLLLGGALYEFAAADCRLTGGHSMQGPELNIGFVVNGVPIADDGSLLGKSGAAAGDCLVLTKPLGTGTLFAAHMQHKADGRDISNAVNAMLQGNGAAAELAVAYGASACTDITGFGLLGHLLEMLAGGGGGGARLQLAQFPLLKGAIKQVAAGVVSTMHAANVRNASWSLQQPRGIDQARLQLLFDPQTSGGLLIAVPPARAAELCTALQERGYSSAAIVGEITDRAQGNQLPIVIV